MTQKTFPQFSSNISLLGEDKDRYQAVYATQVYDSFFGVYAKFYDTSIDGDLCSINKIKFLGISYKGLFNIKLESIEANSGSTSEQSIQIDINIRASFERDPVSSIDLCLPNEVCHICKGGSFDIIRNLLPMYKGSSTDIVDRSYVNGNFDSEFFERDGLYVQQKDIRDFDLSLNYVGDRFGLPNSKVSIKFPGARCTPGINKVLF